MAQTYLILAGKLQASYKIQALKSILAGIYIGLGCMFMVLVRSYTSLPPMLSSILSGVVFTIGLFLVCMTRGELFTGNCLCLIPAMANPKKYFKPLVKTLVINYVFNFVGITIVAMLAKALGYYPAVAQMIAAGKFTGFPSLIVSGILCNILVCLAIWIRFDTMWATETLASIILPVTMFVACGFEHSIADMFFVWFTGPTMSMLTVLASMIFITCGNIIGGMFIAIMLYAINPEMIEAE